ncbi:MFS transporter [Streptomyces sp. NPDC059255]|uniref:MFS transporter n=1 Tax=Streptomyces sp. NPDC059255 TaxID=3346793 RepID=UPI0036CBFD13
MTTSRAATDTPSSPAGKPGLRRVAFASLVGTTVEWYDYFLYGSSAALVFGQVFFPSSDPLTSTLLAFMAFAVGFVARPVGAVVFGHYGDRLGRKKLLVVSLLMMGGSTVLIGCVPSYDTIGMAAPILLTVLRLIQGCALGGEWGGAVLLVSEHGDARRRGFWASWPQAGLATGNILAVGVLAVMSTALSRDDFVAWGWRVPFLLSAVLVLAGLWIRLSIDESPVFKEAHEESAPSGKQHRPLVDLLRNNWRDILIAIGARFSENIAYYVLTTFVLVYCVEHLGMPQQDALIAVVIGSAVQFCLIPCFGALSDRVGRKPVYLAGAVGTGLWAWAFFMLLDTASFPAAVLAISIGLAFHSAMYAPQAAFFSELFATRVRYTGTSVGAQFASVVAGAPAPIIAVALLQAYGTFQPIAVYLTLASVVTVIAVSCARETRGRDLTETPTEAKAAPLVAAAKADVPTP